MTDVKLMELSYFEGPFGFVNLEDHHAGCEIILHLDGTDIPNVCWSVVT